MASYYLERFPRLMELVAARCRGEWGSESAVFIALRAGAEIRFACAVIVVDRPIELRDGTTFAITGRLHTGPLVLDHPPEIRGAGRVVGSSVALTLPMPAGDVVTLDLTAGVRPDPADLPTCPQQMGWPGGTPDHPMSFSLRALRPRRG